jgi:ATP-dependent 26S proteasome regulatory subunit
MSEYIDPFSNRLTEVLSSRSALTAVVTNEEARALRIIRSSLSARSAGASTPSDFYNMFYWNCARGLAHEFGYDMVENKPILKPQEIKPIPKLSVPVNNEESDSGSSTDLDLLIRHIRMVASDRTYKATFVFADFGDILEPNSGQINHPLARVLKDLAIELRRTSTNIIFVGPHWPNVPTLKDDVRILDLPLPNIEAIRARLDALIASFTKGKFEINLTPDEKEEMAQAFRGLSEQEIDSAMMLAGWRLGKVSIEMLPSIIEEKSNMIRSSGALEYIHPRDVAEVGGYRHVLETLIEARRSRSRRWTEHKIRSKGAIFVGIAGSGKDYWASVAGSVMGLPIIRMDMGAVMGEGGGVIGSAETSIARALKIAQAVGGILVLTEFEKAVGGMQSSAKTDGGTTSRTVSKLLVWMQEQDDAFVIATANDVTQLAPELLRRFDNKLFFDLPTREDVEAIVKVHMTTRKIDLGWIDLKKACDAIFNRKFVAAEIEIIVKKAIVNAARRFDHTSDERVAAGLPELPMSEFRLVDADIMTPINTLTPMATLNKDVIDGQREWARTNEFIGYHKSGPTVMRTLSHGDDLPDIAGIVKG